VEIVEMEFQIDYEEAKKQVAKKVAVPAAKGNAWAALGGEEEDDWEVAADAE
jgi:hypothetical protein